MMYLYDLAMRSKHEAVARPTMVVKNSICMHSFTSAYVMELYT